MVKVLCVDDERLVLKQTMSMCSKIDLVTETEGFTRTKEALAYIESNRVDIALLDINMPDMSGLSLAARIKEMSPDTAIIFVTGYSQYAVDAFKLHASGYLMKPVSKEELTAELEHALSGHSLRMDSHITAQTFGDFDLFIDGKPVMFGRSKSKELLAYLIDKRGMNVSRTQAFEAMYEDKDYDRSMQKQFDNIIRNLRAVLKEHGAEDIFVLERGLMRVKPELIDCDMYRFLDGDTDAVNAYRGEYMSRYSWSDLGEAYATRIQNGM